MTALIKKSLLRFLPVNQKDLIIEDLSRKLEAANQRFEMLSGATSDAIWDWDMRHHYILWNDGRKTMFGYHDKKEAHDYSSWYDNIHPSDKEEVLLGLKEVLDQSRISWKALYRFRCANGSYKYTYNQGRIIHEDGKPVRMIVAMQDIDERMDTLQEVEKLSLVASKTENLVIITDANEKIEWVNDGFVKRTGYKLSDVIGKTPRIFQGPETEQAALDRIRIGINAGESVTEEVLNYTKDGQKLWLKININPVFDDSHQLIRLVAMETDITPNKEYENKITAIATELAELIENANAIIFGIDSNYLVNEWNACAAAVSGYSKKEVIGKRLTNFLIDPEHKETVEQLCKTVLEGNPLSLQEFPIINRYGRKDDLLVSATPRKNTFGEIIGVMAVGQDITELTEYRSSLEFKVDERTRELKHALQKETEMVEMKGRFVSIASHEFRSPLSSIQFQINFIKKNKDQISPKEVGDRLDSIEGHAQRMNHLLDDVLTFSKSDAVKIEVDNSKVVLIDFLNKISEEASQYNRRDAHVIRMDFSDIPKVIVIDVNLFRSILINLLTNAIKFSPGKEQIYFAAKGVGNRLVITIRDEGIGIPASEMVDVFEPFHRGKAAVSIQGTGLGLSIVKKSVALLNGTIHADSKVGVGTTFTLTIPIN